MKTVEKLVAEMQATSKELEHARKTDAKLAERLAKELVWLRGLLVYLETQPREEYLRGQLDALNKKLNVEAERFSAWCAGKVGGINELQTRYKHECGTEVTKEQVKALTYLLE